MTTATMVKEIAITKFIKATPERVYKALTDARDLEKWFPTKVETDPRPGGKYKFVFLSKDGSTDHAREGHFIELIPGKLVSYDWNAAFMKMMPEGGPTELPTKVEWHLEPAPGGTKLTLKHTGWGESDVWNMMLQGHTQGWDVFVRNLEMWMDGKEDIRGKELGKMETAR